MGNEKTSKKTDKSKNKNTSDSNETKSTKVTLKSKDAKHLKKNVESVKGEKSGKASKNKKDESESDNENEENEENEDSDGSDNDDSKNVKNTSTLKKTEKSSKNEKDGDENVKNKSASKKTDRYTNIDKGTAPNKETAWAKLTFNTKDMKRYLKNYLTNTLKANRQMKDIQFAATIITELFIKVLAEKSVKYSMKDSASANMYEVSIEHVKRAVKEDVELNQYLGYYVDTFNTKNVDYTSSFVVSLTDVKKFLETALYTDHVTFNHDALNLLVYLTLYNLNRHVDLADSHVVYSKRGSIDFRSMQFANNFLLCGEYKKQCTKKLEAIAQKIVNDSNKASNNSDDEKEEDDKEDDDQDEDDKEEDKKSSNKSKVKVSSKKKSSDTEDEDGSNNSSDDE
jgi:hypothetical protein